MDIEYMTVHEVAAYLKIPEETIYKYARSGTIPAAKLGRHWRFEKGQIDAWYAERMKGSGFVPTVVEGESAGHEGGPSLRILVVDDERAIAKLLQRWLSDAGHEVECAADGVEGLRLVRSRPYDLVFLDLKMPNMDGVAFLQELGTLGDQIPQVVVMTGYADSPLMDQALDFEIRYSIDKPMDRTTVLRLVSSIAARRHR